MPTRRTRTAAPPPDNDDADELEQLPADDLPETAADRVAQLLGSVEGDERAKVTIRKVIAPGKLGYCADLAPDEYERGGVALIRSRWGPGEYRVGLYGTTRGKAGKAGFGLRAFETINIVPDQVAAAPAAGVSDATTRILEAILQGQQQLQQAIVARPSFDIGEAIAKWSPALVLLKDLGIIGGRAPAPTDPVQQLQQLLELRKGMKDLEGDGGGGDENTALATKLLDIVLQARGGTPSPAPTMPPVAMPPAIAAAPRPAAAAPGQPANGANEVALTPEQEEIARLNGLMAQALSMAQQGADVEETATLLYEELPDEIIDIVRTPNWWPMLLHIQPQLAPLQDYLTKVREQIVAWCVEDDAADAAIAGGKGAPPRPPAPPVATSAGPDDASSSSKPAAKTKGKRA